MNPWCGRTVDLLGLYRPSVFLGISTYESSLPMHLVNPYEFLVRSAPSLGSGSTLPQSPSTYESLSTPRVNPWCGRTVALLGLYRPSIFLGISTSYFTGLLGLLMLSMGITLTVDDFKRVFQR